MVGWSVRQKTFKPVGNGSATFHNVWLKWEEQLCHFRTRSRAACPDLSSSHHFQQRSHTYYQQCKPNQVHILTKVHFFSLSSTGNYEKIKSNLFYANQIHWWTQFTERFAQVKYLHKQNIVLHIFAICNLNTVGHSWHYIPNLSILYACTCFQIVQWTAILFEESDYCSAFCTQR